ncbi:hypothetical protein [Streptomyces albipurpureus]|uniref:Uncharacterized protein n=1 Tax=Streptomyces albipurpureus TaxID=2897419 RepID=A0ABT0UIW7_9ACTN|nr:hypothetical protein [Streptomyces sp. CWNU-1]MCM2388588.1 hypothetical protein [Streptomyces sp. CWNU-1]
MVDPVGPIYRAEAIVEVPQGGSEGAESAQLVLGRFATPYAGRALRWTCVQASRIANGLDPDPDVPWSSTLICMDPDDWLDLGDAPTQIRNWVADQESRLAAYRQLLDGAPFTLTASDWSGRYVLTVSPVHSDRPDDAVSPQTSTP